MTGKIFNPFAERGHFQAWMTLQNCIEEVGQDHLPCSQAPDLYHPSQEDRYYAILAQKACDKCPIKAQCGAYAIRYEQDGIWGGMTAGERIKIRRKMGISTGPVGRPGK